MNTLLKRLLPVMALAAMAMPVKAQIGDNEPSQSLLAVQCAMSSGYPAAGYEEYCRRLAKTVAFLSPVQQERVFGYVPQPYSGNDQDAYVTPHYGQSGVTNYERNNGATGGVVFHGTGGSGEPVSASVTPEGVTSGGVTPGDVTPGDVTPGDVTSGDVTSGDVTSGDVTPGDVTPGDVTSGDVTSGDVTSGDVTSGDVTSGGVTSGDVTSGDVTSGDDVEKEKSANDWWGELFSWIGGITGDVDTDAAEMGALGNEYGGSAGDGNNGHGNDPDGFDSSNPGKGREKSQ